jgi:hypothetical protein
MSLETIAYFLAAIPVLHRFLKTQSEMATAAKHAIEQNTDLLTRQTTILESVVTILNNLTERVDQLEGEEEDIEAIGFQFGSGVADEDEDEEEEDEISNQDVPRGQG